MLSFQSIQKDFPILSRKMGGGASSSGSADGKRLVYLDNASTTQKPLVVLEALTKFYTQHNANIHRGVHTLSEEATNLFEGTREKVRDLIGAREAAEIVFTRGTTESVNLVAATWGEMNVSEGDEVVVTMLEHHSNLVPWQQLCARKKAILKIVQVHEDGTLDFDDLERKLSSKTKIVGVTMMSNAIGTIVPVKKIVQKVREVCGSAGKSAQGAKILVDGAQGVPHMGINVQDLDCDFLAFSSHKMCGPTGVGVLYGKRELLEAMPPYQFGGDMVKEVFEDRATWNDVPHKFEAGTPDIANIIAFGAAIDYVRAIGFDMILAHDQELVKYAREQLASLPRLQLYGPSDVTMSGGIVSFNVPGVHPHDVGTILNEDGVAVRTGHHCAQPLLNALGTNATARMSFYFYNTKEDVDACVASLHNVYKIFKQ